MSNTMSRKAAGRIALGVGASVVVVIIVLLDIMTGVWQNLVILSGLAAGLVSFILTALVLDRILVRNSARRWAPVNRLAFSEFLHALADEDASEVSRGEIVARSLNLPGMHPVADGAPVEALHELRTQIVVERELLSDVLSRWAQFLASSGDNEAILLHLAAIAWQFDLLRDTTIDAERDWNDANAAILASELTEANLRLEALVSELSSRLRD